MHEVLVCVVQPWARRQREDGGVVLDVHMQETDQACLEEVSPGVHQLPIDQVEDSMEQSGL